MTKIVFIENDGTEHVVDAANGASVMEAAVKENIPGIPADCGGACACATCHVYVQGDFFAKVGKPEDMEQSMLDFAEGVKENSRLSCQIQVSDDLEGMVLEIPAEE